METLKIPQDLLGMLLFCLCIHLLVSTTSGAQYSSRSNLPLYNRTCTRPQDCDFSHTYVNCIYERCICSDHEYFDKESGLCRIKFPSQCIIKRGPENVQPCIRDAYCAFPLDYKGYELKSAVHGSCQCTNGRPAKPDGLCNSGVSNRFHYQCSYFALILSYFLGQRWFSIS